MKETNLYNCIDWSKLNQSLKKINYLDNISIFIYIIPDQNVVLVHDPLELNSVVNADWHHLIKTFPYANKESEEFSLAD
ncbi:MAG: hypothetical protein B7C24_05405, partial [Bacteroidetes bacterium 4572_77]